jgi:hypothetical protein
LLAATTAALMAGPLAVAGIAQSLAPVVDGTTVEVIELTCKEAKATEDKDLIDEFCTIEQGGQKDASPATDAEKAVADGTATVTKTVESVVRSAPDSGTDTPDGGGGDGDGGGDGGGGGGGGGALDPVTGGTDVNGAGDGNYTPVDENQPSSGGTTDGREALARENQAPTGSYDVNGPYRPGMHSYSELTLQPFAPPIISGPMNDLFPRVAEQLFGTTTTTGADAPVAAGATQASATSATATTPDAAGWLAATATGLLMLVGAGHAIAGGRTPGRKRA